MFLRRHKAIVPNQFLFQLQSARHDYLLRPTQTSIILNRLQHPCTQRYYRKYHNLWFHDPSNKMYTAAENLCGPRTEKVIEWISISWEALPTSLIQESFLLCE